MSKTRENPPAGIDGGVSISTTLSSTGAKQMSEAGTILANIQKGLGVSQDDINAVSAQLASPIVDHDGTIETAILDIGRREARLRMSWHLQKKIDATNVELSEVEYLIERAEQKGGMSSELAKRAANLPQFEKQNQELQKEMRRDDFGSIGEQERELRAAKGYLDRCQEAKAQRDRCSTISICLSLDMAPAIPVNAAPTTAIAKRAVTASTTSTTTTSNDADDSQLSTDGMVLRSPS